MKQSIVSSNYMSTFFFGKNICLHLKDLYTYKFNARTFPLFISLITSHIRFCIVYDINYSSWLMHFFFFIYVSLSQGQDSRVIFFFFLGSYTIFLVGTNCIHIIPIISIMPLHTLTHNILKLINTWYHHLKK